MTALFILFFISFAALAWINFRLSLRFLAILLPAYLIRTNFGFLPTTILELAFGAVFIVWIAKYARSDWPGLKETIGRQRYVFIGAGLLLAASLIAALANPYILKALGIWRAYFLEPILLFVVLAASARRVSACYLLSSLVISSLSVSVLTIIQKLTGAFYPPSLWNDDLSGRPTSFFTSPNAIGLYVVPILLLSAVYLSKLKIKRWLFYFCALAGIAAVGLSFSQGSWIALAAGVVIFLFAIGRKKIAAGILITGVIIALAWPGLRQAILFGDQAGQNRLTLWRYSASYITDSPRNFILGSGLRRFFTEVQKPYYDQEQMERLIYPHNIFLNFWLETGLAGLISFIIIICALFARLRKKYFENEWLRISLIAALSALIMHGLVDVPYFKNDLSMLFWIIAAIAVLASREKQTV